MVFLADFRGIALGSDAETGLHQNHWREYDPLTDRYLQFDPIGLAGGINGYIYANANPLRYIDPMGLETGTGMGPLPPPDPAAGALNDTYYEMQEKNVRGTDRFFHCLAACRASKASGDADRVRRMMDRKETYDEILNRAGLYGDGKLPPPRTNGGRYKKGQARQRAGVAVSTRGGLQQTVRQFAG